MTDQHSTTTTPPTYAIEGDWLVEVVNEHTCGTAPDGYYGAHEPGCGSVPVARLDEIFARLGATQSWVVDELDLAIPGPVEPDDHPERTPAGPFPSREAADAWAAARVAAWSGSGGWSCAPLRDPDDTRDPDDAVQL